MANSNSMARSDADKSHVGANMLVLDSAGDVGQIAMKGMVMAFVNFDGTAASITPRAAANVSSITDNGSGTWTVNFTDPIPDANYSVLVSNHQSAGNSAFFISKDYATAQTANSVKICAVQGSTRSDHPDVQIAIVR